mmetsp:Transcript_10222/g.17547  ORF Transcript_10222/g.17547 Transcript_10222/m.17547 type:complete len:131 (+) Transcript_10222:465-857(+)|eukprot:CAMPEP_0184692844 /NCGR_PEP_ID=MMETSP0313-20130426/1177_1 /TAXON_ID=2792 /ORGANISM="Porphyridium aerugineum, Strain SAG 1380-2" /LENGTH=130 /DNA_ID=CAMNT_0027150727 /DNA_START=429 /DNA_END=821 /DNA_ORIENTATION=+
MGKQLYFDELVKQHDEIKLIEYLDIIQGYGHSIQHLLDSVLISAVLHGNMTAAWIVLDRGANVNTEIHNGSTPLMVASQRGNVQLVSLLLSRKANIHATSAFGKTALDYAEKRNHDHVVQLLRQQEVLVR